MTSKIALTVSTGFFFDRFSSSIYSMLARNEFIWIQARRKHKQPYLGRIYDIYITGKFPDLIFLIA